MEESPRGRRSRCPRRRHPRPAATGCSRPATACAPSSVLVEVHVRARLDVRGSTFPRFAPGLGQGPVQPPEDAHGDRSAMRVPTTSSRPNSASGAARSAWARSSWLTASPARCPAPRAVRGKQGTSSAPSRRTPRPGRRVPRRLAQFAHHLARPLSVPRPAGRLSGRAVALVVQRTARRVDLDPGVLAGHSLRAGFCTEAARAGASERAIMKQTGHRSTATVRGYIRDGGMFLDHAGAGLM